ncbi:MAG: PKD domain-containing protein [Nitrospiraceae bacterium]
MRSTEFRVGNNKVMRSFRLFASFLLLCLPCGKAYAFKIVEPADSSTLASGQTIAANVELGSDTGIVKVRYFWYPESADTLVEQDEEKAGKPAKDTLADSVTGAPVVALPALASTADSIPPFGGSLKVPTDAIGNVRLLAVGEISQGRMGTRSVFDEVILKVQPKAELLSIEFETDKPLRLGRTGQSSAFGHVDSLGKVFELPVVGEFADGVARSIVSPSTGTTYSSSQEKVIKVLPDGLLQIVGNGRTIIQVDNQGKQASLDVTVEVNNEPNEPPIADAGPARTVKAGAKIRLSGLRSTDPEGEALFYSWSQVRGSKVPLLDVNMPEPSFTAPHVSEKRVYRFKLRVTDKKGADSIPTYVDVTVLP